jgi:formylglycine-generating enzyme required for sulfatase activity
MSDEGRHDSGNGRAIIDLPSRINLPIAPNLEIPMARIPAGMARIGQRGGRDNEQPICRVQIPEDFYLGVTPVTVEQFAAWKKPSRPEQRAADRAQHPIADVLRNEARDYAAWVTTRVRTAGGVGNDQPQYLRPPWRAELPTEAQWEYACRWSRDAAGSPIQTDTEYWNGDGESALMEVGWYKDNSGGNTHPVGRKPANGLGLYDLHGNVWEWCLDAYDAAAYRRHGDGQTWRVDETGPDRVLRGGGWINSARYCRAAYRFGYWRGNRDRYFGFRLAWVPGSGSGVGAGGPDRDQVAECPGTDRARRDAAAGAGQGHAAGGAKSDFARKAKRKKGDDPS